MAATNEWTQWHLTPIGWIEGDAQRDFAQRTSRPTPADRVLTSTYRESGSGYTIGTSNTDIWRGGDETRIAELVRQYGPAPDSL